MIFCWRWSSCVAIDVYYVLWRKVKSSCEQSRAGELRTNDYRLDHFNSIEKNFNLFSPENSLWAPPACHILFLLWKRQDWSSHYKQPLCHHACLSILRSWRLFHCWAWMIGEIPGKLQSGNKSPALTKCRSTHQLGAEFSFRLMMALTFMSLFLCGII